MSAPFETAGLSGRDFEAVFRSIASEQARNRREAQRTLTPSMLRAKNAQDLLLIGTKADKSPFQIEDLQQMDIERKRLKAEFKEYGKGARYSHLIQSCLQIDVDRANNRSNDGLGLPGRPRLTSVASNVFIFQVRASASSKHQHHRVKVRLEEWTSEMMEAPESKGKRNPYTRAVANAAAGRISFDCDCGRHQYWYRYVATAGNFAIAPYEYAFPKMRNPDLVGACCKHVIKCLGFLQSPTVHRELAKHMERQADAISFGKDKADKIFITDTEQDAMAKGRKGITDRALIIKKHGQYVRAQKAFDKKQAQAEKANKDMATELARLKQHARKQKSKMSQQSKAIQKLQEKNDRQAQALRVVKLQAMLDAAEVFGKSRDEAISGYQKQNNLSDGQMTSLLNELGASKS